MNGIILSDYKDLEIYDHSSWLPHQTIFLPYWLMRSQLKTRRPCVLALSFNFPFIRLKWVCLPSESHQLIRLPKVESCLLICYRTECTVVFYNDLCFMNKSLLWWPVLRLLHTLNRTSGLENGWTINCSNVHVFFLFCFVVVLWCIIDMSVWGWDTGNIIVKVTKVWSY